MNYVLDTNIVIYAQNGVHAEPLPHGKYFVSIITEIELLSFPGLLAEHERVVRDLLGDMTVVGIDARVKQRAIELRRVHRLRIPDALIAATALAVDAQLLTNDTTLAETGKVVCRRVTLKTA